MVVGLCLSLDVTVNRKTFTESSQTWNVIIRQEYNQSDHAVEKENAMNACRFEGKPRPS